MVEVTREKFNELAMPLVKKTLRSCRRAVKDAGIENQEVLQVVMRKAAESGGRSGRSRPRSAGQAGHR